MLGGKTGYTDDARKTFVAAAERDGRRIMIVKMYGLAMEGNPYWDQAKALFEYGFATPEDVEVGRLVDPAGAADPSRDPAASADPDLVSTGSDSASPMSVRVLVGLLAALAAVVLLMLGVRLSRRR